MRIKNLLLAFCFVCVSFSLVLSQPLQNVLPLPENAKVKEALLNILPLPVTKQTKQLVLENDDVEAHGLSPAIKTNSTGSTGNINKFPTLNNTTTVIVEGYFKKDGTYVSGYTRSAPSKTNKTKKK